MKNTAKMKNTIENKERFLTQYWGQYVAFVLDEKSTIDGRFMYKQQFTPDISHLELTPLSNITDEDSIYVFDMLFGHSEQHKNKPQEFKLESI